MSDDNKDHPEDPKPTSLTKDVARAFGSGLVQGARSTLRCIAWGAAVGAVVLGAAGWWYFGMNGLMIGAGVGAVIGAIGFWMFAYETSVL